MRHVIGVNLARIDHAAGGIVVGKASVIAAKTLPCHTANLKVLGQNPGTDHNVQAGFGQQVLLALQNTHGTQLRHVRGVDLHQAKIPAGNQPLFIAVITDYTRIKATFHLADGAQQLRINVVTCARLVVTICQRGSGGAQHQSAGQQQGEKFLHDAYRERNRNQ